MKLHALKINEALNKAFLKLPITRSQIENFKANFKTLLNNYSPSEGEEHHKNVISEFLKKTYYSPDYYINTKGRYDLVIHNGRDNKSSVGVIIECKSPGNSTEMPVIDNIKSKAFYELMLYYLRERITNQNLELKHLIITNLFEWYIFDAHEFEKHFANNRSLVKQFQDFEEGRLSGKDTTFFYNSIAEPLVNGITEEFKLTYFNLQTFDPIINNKLLSDDFKLIPPFKLLSPEHLLKLKFKNDSNSLDKDFYLELLHIIGLEDIKKGGKSLIGRPIIERRNYGSLLESTIATIQSEDLLSQIEYPSKFGTSKDDQLFNISLELVITWINRILFLKLLEGQLIRYNKGDMSYVFLDKKYIPDFDALNKLFFYVLAVPVQERDSRLKDKFQYIPYLNSSLFEVTELERKIMRVSNLDDSNKIPISRSTILKEHTGKRREGEMQTLHYLFEFLDSYDFSSEGEKKIQEENKALINASVLGLIFEKINGYKDGSFFTPGYITQFICHQTITNAIIHKFNLIKGWKCKTINDLHNNIVDNHEANQIINSLKICDPAVGSGHFLVSALNEIIAIKSDLRILMDREGKTLKDYKFEVINDELIITDIDGDPFEYNPKNYESRRVQETIFNEKQILIENCLFGVDINPNSVKICRLRLWIELLKHAYYKSESQFTELETLPNIDINIKCGNSLISRYSIDSDIKSALRSSKWTIENYREAVMVYRNAETKEQKRSIEKLIDEIKFSFESEISKNDRRFLRLNKLKGELLSLTSQQNMFELTKKEKDNWNNKLLQITKEQIALEKQISEIQNNKIYESSFEWRLEFPEILNDNGDFVGFDVIIGNPPYLNVELIEGAHKEYFKSRYSTFYKRTDIFCLFLELAAFTLSNGGQIAFILPSIILNNLSYKPIRDKILDTNWLNTVCYTGNNVFNDATVDTVILILDKNGNDKITLIDALDFKKPNMKVVDPGFFSKLGNIISVAGGQDSESILEKLFAPTNICVEDHFYIFQGIVTGNNPVYILDTKSQWLDLDIEPELFHILLHGRDFNKWIINNTERRIIYVTEDTQIESFPKAFDYLSKFKSSLESSKSSKEKSSIWYSLHRPRVKSNLDLIPKILVQNTRNERLRPRIVAAMDEFGVYGSQGVNFIIPTSNKYSVYFLLGILNSSLINYLFTTRFLNLAIKADYLKKITFPSPSQDTYYQIEFLVNLILEQRKTGNPDYKISEMKLNNQVYELFSISASEIELIETLR